MEGGGEERGEIIRDERRGEGRIKGSGKLGRLIALMISLPQGMLGFGRHVTRDIEETPCRRIARYEHCFLQIMPNYQ